MSFLNILFFLLCKMKNFNFISIISGHEFRRIFFFLVFFFYFNLILFFNFTILYWFCQITKWIRHRYTCVPHPEPSSRLPPHTISLALLQSHSHQDSMVLAQRQKYRSMEQNRKPRDKSTHIQKDFSRNMKCAMGLWLKLFVTLVTPSGQVHSHSRLRWHDSASVEVSRCLPGVSFCIQNPQGEESSSSTLISWI